MIFERHFLLGLLHFLDSCRALNDIIINKTATCIITLLKAKYTNYTTNLAGQRPCRQHAVRGSLRQSLYVGLALHHCPVLVVQSLLV